MQLMKVNGNWADEMDVQGFMVCTDDSYPNWVKFIAETDFWEDKEVHIGTNESVSFRTKERWLGWFKFVPITDAEGEILIRLFGEEYGETLIDRLRDSFADDLYGQEDYGKADQDWEHLEPLINDNVEEAIQWYNFHYRNIGTDPYAK